MVPTYFPSRLMMMPNIIVFYSVSCVCEEQIARATKAFSALPKSFKNLCCLAYYTHFSPNVLYLATANITVIAADLHFNGQPNAISDGMKTPLEFSLRISSCELFFHSNVYLVLVLAWCICFSFDSATYDCHCC